jgi:hypothetical protein
MELHCAKYKRYFVNFSPSIINIIFTYCNKLFINNVLPIFVAKPKYFKSNLIPGSLKCLIVIFPLKNMWHCTVHICTASIFIHEKQHVLSIRKEQTEKQVVKCNFLWRVIRDVSPIETLLIVFRYYSNTPPKKSTFYVSLKTFQNFILYRLHAYNRKRLRSHMECQKQMFRWQSDKWR